MGSIWLGVFVLLEGIYVLGLPPTGRIVDGINANLGEAPYVVSVRYNDCHECGGSIIGDRWVLTAAHCIYIDFINVSSILYGTTYIQNCQSVRAHSIQVKQAYVNTEYQSYGGYFNDVALIEMKEPFIFGPNARPVTLPQQGEPTPELQLSLLFGWGYPHENGVVPDVLQKVDIAIYPDSICEQYFTTNFSEVSHICAGGSGKGQCSGDSGSALTVNGVQYGIVSWSDRPCATTPGVMTRVASFRNWIAGITGI